MLGQTDPCRQPMACSLSSIHAQLLSACHPVPARLQARLITQAWCCRSTAWGCLATRARRTRGRGTTQRWARRRCCFATPHKRQWLAAVARTDYCITVTLWLLHRQGFTLLVLQLPPLALRQWLLVPSGRAPLPCPTAGPTAHCRPCCRCSLLRRSCWMPLPLGRARWIETLCCSCPCLTSSQHSPSRRVRLPAGRPWGDQDDVGRHQAAQRLHLPAGPQLCGRADGTDGACQAHVQRQLGGPPGTLCRWRVQHVEAPSSEPTPTPPPAKPPCLLARA